MDEYHIHGKDANHYTFNFMVSVVNMFTSELH